MLAKLILILAFIICTHGELPSELVEWQTRVQDANFDCSPPNDDLEKVANSEPVLKVVDCSDPNALYRYDFKLRNGKKPKLGQPFNGKAKISLGGSTNNEKFNFGFRSKKCIQVKSDRIVEILGSFVNDQLQGAVTLVFDDETYVKSFAKDGILIGVQRFFTQDGNFLNMTEISTNQIYLRNAGLHANIVYIGCYSENLEQRCLIKDKSMDELKSCAIVDDDLVVDCFVVQEMNEYLEPDGCKLKVKPHKTKNEKLFNERLLSEKKIFHENIQDGMECSNSLRSWIDNAKDPFQLWYKYYQDFESFDKLDIELDMFKDRFGISNLAFTIENFRGDVILAKGWMENGKINLNVSTELIGHPAWKSKIVIGFGAKLEVHEKVVDKLFRVDLFDRYRNYITGFIKNGKLHGLVQVFGVLTMDPGGHCSHIMVPGLSFIGFYKDGKPNGQCWRFLVGDTAVHGTVDQHGQFTGNDIAFIYQDLELALVGQFHKGLMVEAQESQIEGSKCNENGIRVLQFSPPKGPHFHYQPPTNETFGDQPHLRDPLDAKYVYLKESETFENAHEGAFAARNIPANTTFVLYGGLLYTKLEGQILLENTNKTAIQNGWIDKDNPKGEQLWMYRHNIGYCDMVIDVPSPEYCSTEKYQGTLGHKVNHYFKPKTRYVPIETARYGVTLAVRTIADHKKDDEFLASYGYGMAVAPKWYRDLYKEFARDHPNEAKSEDLEIIKQREM